MNSEHQLADEFLDKIREGCILLDEVCFQCNYPLMKTLNHTKECLQCKFCEANKFFLALDNQYITFKKLARSSKDNAKKQLNKIFEEILKNESGQLLQDSIFPKKFELFLTNYLQNGYLIRSIYKINNDLITNKYLSDFLQQMSDHEESFEDINHSPFENHNNISPGILQSQNSESCSDLSNDLHRSESDYSIQDPHELPFFESENNDLRIKKTKKKTNCFVKRNYGYFSLFS